MKAFRYGQGYAALLMKYYADPAKPKEHSGILSNELLVSDDAHTWRRPYRDTDLGFWSYAEPFDYEGMLTFAAHDNRNFTLFQYAPEGLTRVVAETQGSFVTPAFDMPEAGIALNADASQGAIEVRLLDADKKPLDGAEPVRIESQAGVALALPWDAQVHAGQPRRLHITLDRAAIFSIRESR